MDAEYSLRRALNAIEDARRALNRAKHTEDANAANYVRKAIRELDDAESKVKQALRELPNG